MTLGFPTGLTTSLRISTDSARTAMSSSETFLPRSARKSYSALVPHGFPFIQLYNSSTRREVIFKGFSKVRVRESEMLISLTGLFATSCRMFLTANAMFAWESVGVNCGAKELTPGRFQITL